MPQNWSKIDCALTGPLFFQIHLGTRVCQCYSRRRQFISLLKYFQASSSSQRHDANLFDDLPALSAPASSELCDELDRYLSHGGILPGYPTEEGMHKLIFDRMVDDELRLAGGKFFRCYLFYCSQSLIMFFVVKVENPTSVSMPEVVSRSTGELPYQFSNAVQIVTQTRTRRHCTGTLPLRPVFAQPQPTTNGYHCQPHRLCTIIITSTRDNDNDSHHCQQTQTTTTTTTGWMMRAEYRTLSSAL